MIPQHLPFVVVHKLPHKVLIPKVPRTTAKVSIEKYPNLNLGEILFIAIVKLQQ